MLLRQRYQAGCRSLRHWLKVNAQHGSLVRACTGDGVVLAERHYPGDDWRDPLSGGQACYHCHRPGEEHGHLHLFMPGQPGAELTHLLGIGLDPRGLPLSLFTVNRWVANDTWQPAMTTFALVQRLSLAARDGSLEQALEDRDLEIPSQVAIDWGADLDAVQQQWRSHVEQLRSSAVAPSGRDGAVRAGLRGG
ncbi:MAG: hypothetical protein AB1Z22_01185 [Synechococcaceae cyanobacterium]